MNHSMAFSLVSEICPDKMGMLWDTGDQTGCDTAHAVADQYQDGEIGAARKDLTILATGSTPFGWEPHIDSAVAP